MGEIISAGGAIVGAAVQADAIKNAAQIQQGSLSQELNNVNVGMDPAQVNDIATQAGKEQAVNQLALQQRIDPGLAAARQTAGTGINTDVNNINNPNSQSNQIAAAAVQNATTGTAGLDQGKSALIDAALAQIKAGATLPPDVEAQMVQAGLSQGGSATGGATGTGLGGNILRTVLGTAGINLQQQRQAAAAGLLQQAGQLQQQKQQTLQTLFPSLAQTQLANLQGTEGALNTSTSNLPSTGLSATQTANLWLQRVGAQNQVYQGQGTVGAQAKIGQGQAWSQGIGTATSDIGSGIDSLGMGGMGGGGAKPSGGGAPAGGFFNANTGMGVG